MATSSKIPKELFGTATASGRWCIFNVGIVAACKLIDKLERENKKKTIPLVGYLIHKGKKTYYCIYGIVENKNIYK